MRDAFLQISRRNWFGQPAGLTVLFLTQMWEIFSFYGMRALLVYYMIGPLHLPQNRASYIYGLYTGFVYLSPILGGIVSDRWLGRRRAVLLGGSLMAAGHFMMARETLFYPALLAIILGNGLFLPSLPSQIATLYRADDPRRSTAYNIYYMGANLGGFLAPLVCGTLGERFGWHWGFAAAGAGMVAALLIYSAGMPYLPREPRRTSREVGTHTELSDPGIPVAPSFALLSGVAVAVIVFRAAYEQVGNTVALWAQTAVDRAAGSIVIPMTWFQSLNPLLILALTPVLVAGWTRRPQPRREASAILRMSTGAAIVAIAYLVIASAASWGDTHAEKVHWLWLVAYFVLLTTGELYVLPVGLGLFARLAPSHLAATTIAAWFLASFGGNLLAGTLGALWSHVSHGGFFLLIAAVACASSGGLLALAKALKRVEAVRGPQRACMGRSSGVRRWRDA